MDNKNKIKENKIKKIIPLITKYSGCSNKDNSGYNCKTLNKISSLLQVNQWLRIANKPDDITINSTTKQGTFFKPATHLWYSKGDWIFWEMCCEPEKYLSIIEVDYSRILVLTTKKDYLDFEKQYCIYKRFIKPMMTRKFSKFVYGGSRKINKIKTKTKTNSKLICKYEIKWQDVAKEYDGIAIVPNPTPYFTKTNMTNADMESHIWLKSFDVSSLAIWRQTNKLPITKSITIGKLQDFASESNINNRTPKYCDSLITEITKAQTQIKTQIKTHI